MRTLLEQGSANGSLERALRAHHRRWRGQLDFDEYRELVLARAWERRDQFRGTTEGEFLGWLHRIGWSTVLELWRQRQRAPAQLEQAIKLGPVASSFTHQIDTRDLAEWLLAGLTERERQVLRLRYYEHCSAAETAEILNMTAGAATQLHFRAIQKLRGRVGEP